MVRIVTQRDPVPAGRPDDFIVPSLDPSEIWTDPTRGPHNPVKARADAEPLDIPEWVPDRPDAGPHNPVPARDRA